MVLMVMIIVVVFVIFMFAVDYYKHNRTYPRVHLEFKTPGVGTYGDYKLIQYPHQREGADVFYKDKLLRSFVLIENAEDYIAKRVYHDAIRN